MHASQERKCLAHNRRLERLPTHSADARKLWRKLKSIGGVVVCAWESPDATRLLHEGEVVVPTGADLVMVKGAPRSCHDNAEAYARKRVSAEVFTGWALSSDGIWRYHSWCVRGTTVIETTEPRLAYYGCRAIG